MSIRHLSLLILVLSWTISTWFMHPFSAKVQRLFSMQPAAWGLRRAPIEAGQIHQFERWRPQKEAARRGRRLKGLLATKQTSSSIRRSKTCLRGNKGWSLMPPWALLVLLPVPAEMLDSAPCRCGWELPLRDSLHYLCDDLQAPAHEW